MLEEVAEEPRARIMPMPAQIAPTGSVVTETDAIATVETEYRPMADTSSNVGGSNLGRPRR